MSPMEEFIFVCIKKGANTPDKLCRKTGKAPNYLNTYISILKRAGYITSKCPTCKGSAYYLIAT